MNLSRREIELVVQELRQLAVPSRIQKVFESSPEKLVLQLRSPGVTHHLLLTFEANDTRLHLVDSKPTQPDHPSPFTMLLRKWLHGAWIENIVMSDEDRIVHFDLQVIDPDWQPQSDDEKAPRLAMTLIAELLGRHPNLVLVDDQGELVATGPGQLLGARSPSPGAPYATPPAPPDWADDESIRPGLVDLPADGQRSRFLATHFAQSLQERRRNELEQSIRSRLNARVKKLTRRVENIESDLETIEDADQYRRRGELLQSAYGDVDPGASTATVPDFYEEGMPKIEIPLDPARSLQDNIDHYFHQYRRYTEAKQKVENRLLKSIELRDRADQARTQLDALETIEELRSFREQLLDERLLERHRRGGHSGPRQQKALPPYREFQALSGATILVGRSATDNDTLTTSIARGRDMWLHARDWRGAHVILRLRKNEEPKSEDLIDAATLAAHFSKGSSDTIVDITYTHAKYVRKPGSAPAGLVTVGGGSTLAVRLESQRLERLLDSEIPQR